MPHALLKFVNAHVRVVVRCERAPKIVEAVHMASVRVFVLMRTIKLDACRLLKRVPLLVKRAQVVRPPPNLGTETFDLLEVFDRDGRQWVRSSRLPCSFDAW